MDVPDFDLTLPAGASSGTATFTLTPIDDRVHERHETITISSTSIIGVQPVTLELRDDDISPTGITLTAAPDSIGESDGATSVTVTATVTGGTTYGAVQALNLTVAGSGTPGSVGFTPVSGLLLPIAPETTTGSLTFTLTPTDNQADELDETITIGSTSSLVIQPATLLLTDNDEAPTGITLSVNPALVNEADGDTIITVTGTVTGSTTFGIAQSIDLTIAGSGAAGVVGFTPVTGVTLTIPAGADSDSTTFTLSPTDNADPETDETITISSTHPQVSNTVVIQLQDDDTLPISLSVHPTSVHEGDGATTITVTATSTIAFADAQVLPVTVTGSGLTEAVDFTTVPGFDLTLAASETTISGTFTLTPTDDQVDEQDETLSIASSHMEVGVPATVTLLDDDSAPDGVMLSVTPDDIREGDGTATITVTATVGGDTRYGTEKILNVVLTGTGVAGAVDYAPVSEFALTVPAEADLGAASFVITPEDDQEGEADETITISSDSTFVLSGAMLVIRDDDGGRTSRDAEAEKASWGIAPPYPNPASGTVSFVVSSQESAEWARLRLYNMLGQEVAVPYEGALRVGNQTIRYDGRHLPAGIYVYVFESRDTRISGQLIMAQ